jgi:DnaJ-class molecular chaperone
MNDYEILGISRDATKNQIKKAYRDIAIKCHPDKLNNCDEITKMEKIEIFKKSTNAYNHLMNNDNECDFEFDFEYENDYQFWSEIITNTIDYFSKMKKTSAIIKHTFNIDVSYLEIFKNTKRKIRILLKNMDEPIFINLYCGKYPSVIFNYIDDDCNEHEILINMIVVNNNKKYKHVIKDDHSIDLITNIECTLYEYCNGVRIELMYIDDTNLIIEIPSFTTEFIYKDFGLNNGNLIINIKVKIFEKCDFDKIDKNDKIEMMRILKMI